MSAYLQGKTNPKRLEKICGQALSLTFRRLSHFDKRVIAGVVSRCGWTRWASERGGKWEPVSALLMEAADEAPRSQA
jgi:hypothetical protein